MQKTQITAILAVSASILVVGYYKIHQHIIVKRFPLEDPKLVKKHYNAMLREISSGSMTVDDWSEADLDAELIRRIRNH
jgi:hypothetical protein